jgi:hypothetical protein
MLWVAWGVPAIAAVASLVLMVRSTRLEKGSPRRALLRAAAFLLIGVSGMVRAFMDLVEVQYDVDREVARFFEGDRSTEDLRFAADVLTSSVDNIVADSLSLAAASIISGCALMLVHRARRQARAAADPRHDLYGGQ